MIVVVYVRMGKLLLALRRDERARNALRAATQRSCVKSDRGYGADSVDRQPDIYSTRMRRARR